MKVNFNILTDKLNNICFAYHASLYHSCSLDSAIYNLENNSIKGKINKNQDGSTYTSDMRKYVSVEHNYKNKYYNIPIVSLTRNSQYCIAKAYNNNFCLLELDGNKLSNNYSLKPINFFTDYDESKQGIYGKTEYELYPEKNRFGNRLLDEYEERIIGQIKNLDNYLKRIIIFIDKNNYSFDDNVKVNKIKAISENLDITLYKTYLTNKDKLESKRFVSAPLKSRLLIRIYE